MLKIIREILSQSFYRNIAIVSAVLFGWLNLWLLTRTTTLASFFQMAWGGDYFNFFSPSVAKILSVSYASLYWLMTVAIVAMFGIYAALLVWFYKNSSLGRAKITGEGIGGTLAAMFASGCPVCGTFLFTLIGVTTGIAIFPFRGLELKALSLILIGSALVFASKKITILRNVSCSACEQTAEDPKKISFSLTQGLIWIIIILFSVNQFLIGSMIPRTTETKEITKGILEKIASVFSLQDESREKSARETIAPLLNPDGRTTSLVKQPTITEVPVEPKDMDTVEAAKVVVFPKGTPFYAPEGISFDDPVRALGKWQSYEKSIQLNGELETRYQKIISAMTCDYCCGSPTNVATINRCGCDHAAASRSIAKYLLKNFGDKYSNEEISGEIRLWQNGWYPKGRMEDYLLATGRGDVLGHKTHGGTGTDGMHGINAQQ